MLAKPETAPCLSYSLTCSAPSSTTSSQHRQQMFHELLHRRNSPRHRHKRINVPGHFPETGMSQFLEQGVTKIELLYSVAQMLQGAVAAPLDGGIVDGFDQRLLAGFAALFHGVLLLTVDYGAW